jgi:DNA-binding transcriptional LysR family regulator
MFDWNDARYFLAVARRGSLSSAARQLRVQQSTVGRRLAALEEALQTRLFERTPDGYLVTAAGEAFVDHAERIESEALAVERRLMGSEALVAGSVRVTAPQSFGFTFLVPLLARLRREQPEIMVELVADNFPLSLSRREADMALRLGRPREQPLVMRKLAVVSDGLYAARAYLARRGSVADGGAGHDFIGYGIGFHHAGIIGWVSQRLRAARCVLTVNGSPGSLSAALAGMGIAELPCWLGDPHKELIRVLPEHAFSQDLWLVVHRDLRHAARIRVVSEFFAREMARHAATLAGQLRGKPSGRRR